MAVVRIEPKKPETEQEREQREKKEEAERLKTLEASKRENPEIDRPWTGTARNDPAVLERMSHTYAYLARFMISKSGEGKQEAKAAAVGDIKSNISFLDGGAAYVPPSHSYRRLLACIAYDYWVGNSVYISETVHDPEETRRLVMEFDLNRLDRHVEIKDLKEMVELLQACIAICFPGGQLSGFIMQRPPEECICNKTMRKYFSYGFHLAWTSVTLSEVHRQQLLRFVWIVFESKFGLPIWNRDPSWQKIIDKTPSLRPTYTRKADKCPVCENVDDRRRMCEACWFNGRIDRGRVYTPVFQFNDSGELLRFESEKYTPYDVLILTTLRDLGDTPRPDWRPPRQVLRLIAETPSSSSSAAPHRSHSRTSGSTSTRSDAPLSSYRAPIRLLPETTETTPSATATATTTTKGRRKRTIVEEEKKGAVVREEEEEKETKRTSTRRDGRGGGGGTGKKRQEPDMHPNGPYKKQHHRDSMIWQVLERWMLSTLPLCYINMKFHQVRSTNTHSRYRITCDSRRCQNLLEDHRGGQHNNEHIYWVFDKRTRLLHQKCFCNCPTTEGRVKGPCSAFTSEPGIPIPRELHPILFTPPPDADSHAPSSSAATFSASRAGGRKHYSTIYDVMDDPQRASEIGLTPTTTSATTHRPSSEPFPASRESGGDDVITKWLEASRAFVQRELAGRTPVPCMSRPMHLES